MSQVRLVAIRDSELSIDEVRAAVADPAAGGIVLFAGAVRDNDTAATPPESPTASPDSPEEASSDLLGGRRMAKGVSALSYSAHPTALEELRLISEEIVGKYPDVIGLAAVHRIGDLEIGDLAVVVAVSCGHRAEAFAACHALIDELKASVPIWKHQRFTDGSAEWVGSA